MFKTKKRTFILSLIFLTIVILPIAIYQYYNYQLLPVANHEQESSLFIVSPGQPIATIAKNLEEKKLIKNAFAFRLLVGQLGIGKNIQYGDFLISPNMSSKEIAILLTHGAIDIWVTIPEGMRIEQQAEVIEEKLRFGGNESFNFNKKEYAKVAEEGYMFPDTYLIPKDATAQDVANELKKTFTAKAGEILEEPDLELSTEEIITIASLIEREAKSDQEKPTIAGIINNRLSLGMPLQIDATVQYAKGYDSSENTWWPQITREDYTLVKSVYNTYLNPGLPPGPIASPGISSIEAAISPNESEYLYYLHDSEGNIHYAQSIEEHNQNIEQYL